MSLLRRRTTIFINNIFFASNRSFFIIRTIYEQLASVSNLEAQDLFQQRVEEIETSIRYCSYKMGKKESIQKLIDNISEDPAVISLREKLEVSTTRAYNMKP